MRMIINNVDKSAWKNKIFSLNFLSILLPEMWNWKMFQDFSMQEKDMEQIFPRVFRAFRLA